MQNKKSSFIAAASVMTVCALALSYTETLIPLFLIPIPGFKLGLCNIVFVLGIFTTTRRQTLLAFTAKTVLVALLFGNMSSWIFSVAGGSFSSVALLILHRFAADRFSYIGICQICAAMHNFGQMIAACLLFKTYALLGYLPILLITSIVSGTITGLICIGLARRFRHIVPLNR